VKRAVAAFVTVAAALALAWAAGPRGCGADDRSPEGAVRAFIAAARAGDEEALWELLSPATRARVSEAAVAAGDRAGESHRYRPLDVLDVGSGEGHYAPTDIVAREIEGDRVTVDVLGPNRRDAIEVVKVDGRWKIDLRF
jgi:hypothetical protein